MLSRARRLIAAAVLASIAAFGFSSPAAAEPPVTIPPGQFVVDNSDVLSSGEESDLEGQINELLGDTGIGLTVIFVESFTDPTAPAQWAEEVFNQAGMSSQDALLVVATDDRQAYFGSDTQNPIYDSAQDIYPNSIVPWLSDSNWFGAAEGAVSGIENVASGGSASSGGSGPSFFWIMIIVAGVAVVGFMILNRRGKNKPARLPNAQGPMGRQPRPAPLVPLDQLRRQADQLLVAADDSIRSSVQELGFAEAQYGKEAIAVFAQDIEHAREHLSESFRLQQQLDDDIPDTEDDQRKWLDEIISRCGQVNENLQEHANDFRELRQLESNAEQRIAEVTAEQEPLSQKLSSQVAILEGLTAKYEESAISQIMDNAEQASDRLAFSASSLQKAQEQVSSDRAQAAVSIQNAEEAQDQAEVLMDAISRASEGLEQADRDLESAVALASRDVAQAQALIKNGSQPSLAGPVAGVAAALETIKTSLSRPKHDPIRLISQLNDAGAPLSGALARLRDQAEQNQAAREQLASLLRTADSRIRGTEDYIHARRGGVRSSARTRLAEARRCLDDAHRLARNDPAQALAAAQRAIQLADQAARMAENDVDNFGGGGFGGGRGGMFDGVGGAVLGGILIDSILNGGRGGGHHGGGGMFGGGGFGGFGGGGGGFGGGGGGGFGGAGGRF